jgi:hypothetical protein
VVVVLPPLLRIAFVLIAPFPPPRPLFKLRVVQFFFDLSVVPFVRVRVSASFSNEEEDVVVGVVVKEEIKRSFLLLLLLLRAENTPSLSLSRETTTTPKPFGSV